MTETLLDVAHAALQSGGEAEALRFYQVLADAPVSFMAYDLLEAGADAVFSLVRAVMATKLSWFTRARHTRLLKQWIKLMRCRICS